MKATEATLTQQLELLPISLYAAVIHSAFPSLLVEGFLQARCNDTPSAALATALHTAAHFQELVHFSFTQGVLPDAQGFATDTMPPQQQVLQQQKYSQLKTAIEVCSSAVVAASVLSRVFEQQPHECKRACTCYSAIVCAEF